MRPLYRFVLLSMALFSCNPIASIKNEKEGKLTATHQLVESSEKNILLDNESAPKPPYMQMIKSAEGEQILTFLNPYKNAIFFYDYENGILVDKIEYEKEGPDGILSPAGYFIKSMDSVYVYNKARFELALTDSLGHVKQRISLIGNSSGYEWTMYYPQYFFYTVNPLFEANGKLVLTGMSPFSIADSLIGKFKFTANVDIKSGNVEFMHTYPEELYGSGAIWDGEFYTQAHPVLSPDGELIHSFPVSHDVYVARRGVEDYKTVYAGSNTAGTINSIDNRGGRVSNEDILPHILQYDFYNGIMYDTYRKVYYRLMLQGIPNATVNTSVFEKPVVVIIMDEQFNYMGETVLGPWQEWNWQNSFVTPEGLVMEYFNPDLDSEEEYLTLKTFTIEKM
ncbi:MAG: DUF4221 domain-containing protein [Bacteroidales bacterium]|jgi:hypothetical protein|nr:DUF4221 domain-containing protein [Bacteroidales bacterium]